MVLSLLWMLGMVVRFTMGGLLHVLLVVALLFAMVNYYLGGKEA
jgi:uncharacterized protein DUF5670